MFDWEERRQHVDKYLRAVALMQFIAVIAILAGLLLAWWDSAEPDRNAFDLFNDSIDMLRERNPAIIGQPLIVLWMLWPMIVIGGLRGFTGILVTPVSYRILAWVAWGVAMLVLVHFLINFGSELSEDSPLKDGRIGIGFWLTGSSMLIMGGLLVAESIIRPPEEPDTGPVTASGPVEDAERLWAGDYQTCPFCGMLNDPQARKCYNCNNLLFNFTDDAGL